MPCDEASVHSRERKHASDQGDFGRQCQAVWRRHEGGQSTDQEPRDRGAGSDETRDEHDGRCGEPKHELPDGLNVASPSCPDQGNERRRPEGSYKKVEDEQRRKGRRIEADRVAGERERRRDRERARGAQHWDEVALGERDQKGDEAGQAHQGGQTETRPENSGERRWIQRVREAACQHHCLDGCADCGRNGTEQRSRDCRPGDGPAVHGRVSPEQDKKEGKARRQERACVGQGAGDEVRHAEPRRRLGRQYHAARIGMVLRRPEREEDRATDGVPIHRQKAPTHDVAAGRQRRERRLHLIRRALRPLCEGRRLTAVVDQSQRYDPGGFVEPQRNPVGGAIENRPVDGRTPHEDGVRVRALACCRQQNGQQHGRGQPRRPPDHE